MSIADIESRIGPAFDSFVRDLLPDGRQVGDEWSACNPGRGDRSPGSFKINLRSQKWADFADGEKGCGPVALHAYVRNYDLWKRDSSEAIREALRELGPEWNPLNGGAKKKPHAETVGREAIKESFNGSRTLALCPDLHPKFKGQNPAGVWDYYSNGVHVSRVWRYDRADGGKDIRVCSKVGDAWQWTHQESPRVLYRGQFAIGAQQVIVVEGEKSADAAALLCAPIPVIAWPGGSSLGHVRKASWSDLSGVQRVLLWPDADAKNDRDGNRLPLEKQPGFKAMLEVGRLLSGPAVSIVVPPDNLPDGYDAADALADGWTGADARKFFADNKRSIGDFVAVDADSDDAGDVDGSGVVDESRTLTDAEIQAALEDRPFRLLGYDRGRCFYLPAAGQQVVSLTVPEHTAANILQLAPLEWWTERFTGRNGLRTKVVQDSLYRASVAVGIFDAESIRGLGAWWDEGRSVLHVGDRLLVEGIETDLHKFDGKYVYERGPSRGLAQRELATDDEARAVAELADVMSCATDWQAQALIGWAIIAPICGALYWRPHCWVTGSAGSGKSWILDHLIQPLLGPAALMVQSATTEAGIRQALRTDALPVLFDEAETEDRSGQDRIQRVLELARQASSDSAAVIAKGSANGGAQFFRIRSCFLLSSIGVGLAQQSDESRCTVVEMVRGSGEAFDALRTAADGLLTPEFCAKIRARTVSKIREIRENAETLAVAIQDRRQSRREGDQLGAIAAGYLSLTRGLLTRDDAESWVAGSAWGDNAHTEPDERRCIGVLMESRIRVDWDGSTIERTVADLLLTAAGLQSLARRLGRPEVDSDAAEVRLAAFGLRFHAGRVYVSTSHDEVRRSLRDSPWSGTYARILKRLPGAEETGSFRFGAMRRRAISIPLDQCVEVERDLFNNQTRVSDEQE